ncbi:MAG: thioredoxin family protein [Desulfobacterales bacterium]|nr:thioredoxin family protein [Desulfobacterales bacterium]
MKDHAEGLRQAQESGRPALVYFTADWCAPCVELKKYIWPDRSVVEASKRFVMIYVDVDKEPGTLAAYRVRGIPAIFFLSARGGKPMAFSGDRSAANLARQMKAAADSFLR